MGKFLIAGLGNPGPEYAETRHNIGFKVADKIVFDQATQFTHDRLVQKAVCKIKGKSVVVIKPQTYMNLSGKAILYWMQAEKILPENLLVITDDIALPFGTLRLKPKGSAGGHNGLRSIEELMGNDNYARLRFGVGSDFAKGRQVNYVLGAWNDLEKTTLESRIEMAAQMAVSFCTTGIQLTMTQFNNK